MGLLAVVTFTEGDGDHDYVGGDCGVETVVW